MVTSQTKQIHSMLVILWKKWAFQANIQPHFITLNYEEALVALEKGDIDVIAIGQYEDQLKSSKNEVKTTQLTSLAIHAPFYKNDVLTDQKAMYHLFINILVYIA